MIFQSENNLITLILAPLIVALFIMIGNYRKSKNLKKVFKNERLGYALSNVCKFRRKIKSSICIFSAAIYGYILSRPSFSGGMKMKIDFSKDLCILLVLFLAAERLICERKQSPEIHVQDQENVSEIKNNVSDQRNVTQK